MGKYEVLNYLTTLRLTGDDSYHRYSEVHESMRRLGMSFSYPSVWRTMNSLYSEHLLEVDFEFEGLQRTAKFRARIASRQVTDKLKREYDTYSSKAETRRGAKHRETVEVSAHG